MFILFVTIILTSAYYYLKKRFVNKFDFSPRIKKVIDFLIIFIFASAILSLPVRLYAGAAFDFFVWFSYVNLGLISFIFTFTVLRDIIMGIHRLFIRLRTLTYKKMHKADVLTVENKNKSEISKDNINRKIFFHRAMNFSILGLSGAGFATGYSGSKIRYKINNVDVFIENLHESYENIKICHVSDLHIGPMLKKDFTENLVSAINKQNADIVAITGDLVDGSVSELKEHTRPLSKIKSKYGNFFCTGNHEYYSGVNEWVDEIRNLGFNVLLNENNVLINGTQRLIIAGVTDINAERHDKEHKTDPEKAASGVKKNDISILLAHQPRSIFKASEHNFTLQLTGHTHGGQFFPWTFVAGLVHPYLKGLHKHKNTHIFVTQGAGYWGPPVRLGSEFEVAVLKLRRA